MAILYTGSTTTQKILGSATTSQNVIVCENGRNSSRTLVLRYAGMQMDISGAAALAAVKPWVRVYRGSFSYSNLTDSIILPKGAFDSSLTSDTYIKFWSAYSPDALTQWSSVVATNSTKQWSKFAPFRMHTAVEQVNAMWEVTLLPALLSNQNYDMNIYPGEALIFTVEAAAGTSNPQNNNWIFNLVWTEETLSTYTISGTVTLSGTGVDGAEVTVIVADDTSMTNAYLHSIQVTAGGGLWSAAIPTGKIAYAYAQNYTGGVYYTAPGNPFVTNA